MKTSPEIFFRFCETMGLSKPVAEYRFDVPIAGIKAREWRFDYAWPECKVALEVEGGVWSGGRHTSGKGFAADMVKYNRAVCLGWGVLRVQPSELMTLATVQMIKEARCA